MSPLPCGRQHCVTPLWHVSFRTKVHAPKGTLISLAVLAQLIVVTNRQTDRDRQTDHATVHSNRSHLCTLCMRCSLVVAIIIIYNNNKLGVFSSTTLNFISELGRRICVHTGDARETSYLFQRISIMLQRFNSVHLHDTLPVHLPDL